MKTMILAFTVLFASSVYAKDVTRCGWVANPTPANYWINDADGEWIMSVQGGYQADGMDNVVSPDDSQYVKTNGNYGYWCGCVTGTFDAVNMQVVTITSSKAKTLKTCLEDQNLSNP